MANHSVLMVDDDPFMREISRIQLEAAGFAVETRADGADALSIGTPRRPYWS